MSRTESPIGTSPTGFTAALTVLGVVVANLGDAATFALFRGRIVELNPLVVDLPLWFALVAKAAAVALLIIAARHQPSTTRRMALLVIGLVAGLAGAASNLAGLA